MIGTKKIVCVIPARLRSSRFPRKMLAMLSGKPLIQRAWEGAVKIPFFDEVVLAIDSEEVANVVDSFGGRYIMTSPECANGTARLVEIQSRGLLKGDVWVNWQGDEPFLSLQVISDLLQSCETSEADVWTLKTLLEEESKISDPNFCKVVSDKTGRALYFSRSPIPYVRDEGKLVKVFRHVGLYAYSDAALKKISFMDSCEIEEAEMLEQLRFLFYGLNVQVHETKEDSIGIDTPEHLAFAEEYMKRQLCTSFN